MSDGDKKETPAERTPLCKDCPMREHADEIHALFKLLEEINSKRMSKPPIRKGIDFTNLKG